MKYKFVLISFICSVISLLFGGRINFHAIMWLLTTTFVGSSFGIVYSNTEISKEIYRNKSIFLYLLMMIFNILWLPLLYRADNPVIALFDIIITGIFAGCIIYFNFKINNVTGFIMLLYLTSILYNICINITFLY